MWFFERLIVGLASSAAIALVARLRGSLTRSGAWAAVVVGTASYVGGGVAFFSVLLTFFVTSTLLGRVGRRTKDEIKREFEKGDTRDARQVFANGGVAALCALGMLHAPHPAWAGAYVSALATANADTWATEIGTLSRGEPWSLRGFKRVPRGTSGAVSGLGLLATLCGGALMGQIFALSSGGLGLPLSLWTATGTVAGLLGALTDSVLGASLQAGYRCATCDVLTEGKTHHCGRNTQRVRGIAWFDNDLVNFGATLIGALLGGLSVALTLR